MGRHLMVTITMLSVCFAVLPSGISGDMALAKVIDESETVYDSEKGEKTIKGQHFLIAEDRRIESIGRFMEPEGLDKYLGRKMDKTITLLGDLLSEVTKLTQEVSGLQEDLDEMSDRLKRIEKNLEIEEAGSEEDAPEAEITI